MPEHIMRGWIGWQLRKYADRIDWAGAPKLTHWTFTIENGRGVVFREDGKGCRIAYLGNDEYERAHSDADNGIDLSALPWRREGRRHG